VFPRGSVSIIFSCLGSSPTPSTPLHERIPEASDAQDRTVTSAAADNPKAQNPRGRTVAELTDQLLRALSASSPATGGSDPPEDR
jgi:hypothetical protein